MAVERVSIRLEDTVFSNRNSLSQKKKILEEWASTHLF
jgi:hypothetical protein